MGKLKFLKWRISRSTPNSPLPTWGSLLGAQLSGSVSNPIFNPNNSLFILLQISLLSICTPALMTDYYGAFSTSTFDFLGQILSTIIDTSCRGILTCFTNNEQFKRNFEWNDPPTLLPPTLLIQLSYGEQSPALAGPPARGSSNELLLQFHYIWGKQRCRQTKPRYSPVYQCLVCLQHRLPWGSISSTLTGRSLILVPNLFRSSGVVNLHFLCPNSASVISSCYCWHLLTWNCLQLEFSDNDLPTKNCKLQIQPKIQVLFVYHVLASQVLPSQVLTSQVLASSSPMSRRLRVPHSGSPKSWRPKPHVPVPLLNTVIIRHDPEMCLSIYLFFISLTRTRTFFGQ